MTYTPSAISAPTMQTDNATGIGLYTATLNGQVLNTGGSIPDVDIFYGPSDGGTDPGSWSSNVSVGPQSGSFDVAISGLAPNTPYFVNVRGVNAAGTGWGSTANFTTLALGSLVLPPSGLTLTDLGAYSVLVEWTKDASANNTIIRFSRIEEPTSNTSGEQAYYGDEESVTISGLSLTIDRYIFSAWGEYSGNVSASYVTADIGGENVEITIASGSLSISGLDFGQIFEALILIAFVIITFWQKHPYWRFILNLGTCFLMMTMAFIWIDDYRVISVVMIFFGLCFLGDAVMFALKDKTPARGWSQFKGWVDRWRD